MSEETAGTVRADPNVLGRSLAARRRQLGLTPEQVAERAAISPQFITDAEQRPVAISRNALFRLADALETTVHELLVTGRHQTPGEGAAVVPHELVHMSRDESWAHLLAEAVGRVGLSTPEGPLVLPVNYEVEEGTVAFRTDAEGALGKLTGRVAFEVDHLDQVRRLGWSVLLRGTAAPVTDPAEVRHLDIVAKDSPWPGGPRDQWIRITPQSVTGRRILPVR